MKNILIITLSLLIITLSSAQGDSKMGFQVDNIGDINSQYLDFGTSFYNDGIVFSSNRRNNAFTCTDPVTKGGYSDIYYAKETSSGFSTPTLMGGNAKSKYHDGVPTFNAANDRMIISRSNANGKNDSESIVVKLYESTLKNGKWSELRELSFCSDDFSTMHPVYAPEENVLYFASNRPGGNGGMDLYSVSYVNQNWGEPINMGSAVNSADNEVFPFVDKNNVLFFSSNGHGSKGGLDVFAFPMESGNIIHLDSPINTTSDDFGFAVKSDGVTGFVSSDRNGGEGKDDIYKWNYVSMAKEIELCTQDDAGQMLSSTDISITPEMSGLGSMIFEKVEMDKSKLTTNSNGKTNFVVFPNASYSFVVSKNGYESVTKTIAGSDLINENGCFTLTENSVWIEGIVSDKSNGNLLNDSKVEISSSCLDKTEVLKTDKKGNFKLEGKCGCKYQVYTTKNGYSDDRNKITISGCKDVKKKIKLSPKKVVRAKSKIVIQDIYYDYDKFNIRPDAVTRLNNLVSILNQYPSLSIQMISHTDKRGNMAYNERLSANRAKAAKDYLVSKGIQGNRIVLDHKGKLEPKVNCDTCDENSHQKNRRTEIRVVVNSENVEVIYSE